MRSLLAAAALAAATPLAAQLPAGWSARADRGALTGATVTADKTGLRVVVGPALILWRAADAATGPVAVRATVTQAKASGHMEGYGLFVGGADLAGEGQRYSYFLVRPDGTFLVKRREGSRTVNVTRGWTAHPAVAKADAAGAARNRLEVDATTPGATRFLVNGTEVWVGDVGATAGIAGLRVNHNLDLLVEGFEVRKK